MIEITVTEGGQAKPVDRQLKIAAMVIPGLADNSITIPLGYGRKKTGPAGEDAGFNAYLLRTATNPHFITADGKSVTRVKVAKVPGHYKFASVQEHWSIEGRGLVREATVDGYRKDPQFVKKIAEDAHLPPKLPSIYSHPPLSAPQQWGMTIDLNTCTGCSACVVACHAENNVPVVGKLQVSHGRAMHWLRIDRYFASTKEFNQDRGNSRKSRRWCINRCFASIARTRRAKRSAR
jgi:molybdopterin-containing oxidoreductase family iron-sulfur binding subunit